MVLTIRGETPAKKNSRINTRSGRSFPNKRYAEWLDSALGQVSRQMAEAYAEDREWQVLPEKHTYDAYDKGNPRCIVSLEVMGDNIFRKQ